MKTGMLLRITVLIVLVATVVIAGKGGVQTSAVTVDCGDANKETDVLDSGGRARIWINVPAGTNTDGLTYRITDKTKPIVNATTFDVTACGDGYFFSDITLPAAQGNATLSVDDADGFCSSRISGKGIIKMVDGSHDLSSQAAGFSPLATRDKRRT